MITRLRFLLLLPALLTAAATFTSAQWVDGGRTQSQDVRGNGALLVHDDVMYFWNEENHFQISTDNGATWNDPPDSIGGANPHVTRMSAAGGRVYAGLNFGTGQGIPIYSTDQGVTWQPDTLGAPGHALGWGGRPVVSDIYAWGRWLYVKWDQPSPYYIKSFDGAFAPSAHMNIGGNNPSSVVAKGDTLFAAGNKIYYTTDGGATWTTPANNGYSGFGGKLFVDGSRLYMFAYQGWLKPCYLYYSDDNAENWTEVDITSLTTRKIVNGDSYFPVAFFIKGDRIEFSTTQESFNTPANIWKSTDFGTTWDRDTAGLPTKFLTSIGTLAYTNDGTLWAVPSHHKLYKQKIDEGTGGGRQVTTAPMLLNPSDGEQLSGVEPFIWNAVTNATSYQLQIATDATFASVRVDQSGLTDTTLTIASLTAMSAASLPGETSYYWRVRGIGTGEQAGPWSSTGSFTIVTAGVDDEAGLALVIGPNPCHDRLTLRFSDRTYRSIELRDLLGRVMRSENDLLDRVSLAVDVADLASGSYWLVLKSTNGRTHISPIQVR